MNTPGGGVAQVLKTEGVPSALERRKPVMIQNSPRAGFTRFIRCHTSLSNRLRCSLVQLSISISDAETGESFRMAGLAGHAHVLIPLYAHEYVKMLISYAMAVNVRSSSSRAITRLIFQFDV